MRRENAVMDVKPVPGLEQLPYAEVWFHELDEPRWREACARARELGKTGLEVWTTDRTPEVVAFLEPRGYEEVRRYVISELDVAAAPDPDPPAFGLVTLAQRPDLADALYALAQIAHADQPGRSESHVSEAWYEWGLRANPPESYFIALDDDDRVLGYGYLELEEEQWKNGFMAVARDARGRGIAGAIKRAQIAWAKANGVPTLRTANEVRLEGMLALNRRFGYRTLYDEIVLRGPSADALRPARALLEALEERPAPGRDGVGCSGRLTQRRVASVTFEGCAAELPLGPVPGPRRHRVRNLGVRFRGARRAFDDGRLPVSVVTRHVEVRFSLPPLHESRQERFAGVDPLPEGGSRILPRVDGLADRAVQCAAAAVECERDQRVALGLGQRMGDVVVDRIRRQRRVALEQMDPVSLAERSPFGLVVGRDRAHVDQVAEPDRRVVRRIVVRRIPPAFEVADELRTALAELRHVPLPVMRSPDRRRSRTNEVSHSCCARSTADAKRRRGAA
jgi:GNAT superfamily N-acetyltransferase